MLQGILDAGLSEPRRRLLVLRHLGVLHHRAARTKEAGQYFEKTYDIARELGPLLGTTPRCDRSLRIVQDCFAERSQVHARSSIWVLSIWAETCT